jgi:hypothetical protein
MSPVKYEVRFLSQKKAFFIVTAVKTSNFTFSLVLCPQLPVTFVFEEWKTTFYIPPKQCGIVDILPQNIIATSVLTARTSVMICLLQNSDNEKRQTGRSATYRFSFAHGSHFELVERIVAKDYPIPLRQFQNYISGFRFLSHGQ